MGDERRRSRPGDGSVSVIDPAHDAVVATWSIPDGGSPDMGGVSADGRILWLSGRYDAEVYAFDTTTGVLAARIKVPARTTRFECLPPTRPLFARPYRQLPMKQR